MPGALPDEASRPAVSKPAAVASRPWRSHAERMANLLTVLLPKRRWMQLSLRTVLVVVTLLCLALDL